MQDVKNDFSEELIAPCGMNCRICLAYFGYHLSGDKRKMKCPGCKPRDKNCAFIKKHCKKLTKKELEYCYECNDFPCEQLKKLDSRYRKRFDMSMIDNLRFIKEKGMDAFLESQVERYKCPICNGVVCVHNNICYSCNSVIERKEKIY